MGRRQLAARFRCVVMKQPAPRLLVRDRKLLHLAQQAALDGSSEVVLDDHALSELAADSTGAPQPHGPPHTELRFSLHAPTTEALDRGEFTLVVLSAARRAGTTTGRFLHLFESEDRARMLQAFASLPTLIPGSLLAQVSCPPLSPRTGNLARTPALFPPIPISEHRPDGDAQILLEDLAVGGDAHRLFLVSLSQGRIVEPLMVNAVEFRRATHPLARFLYEITTARAAACVPFAWGAATVFRSCRASGIDAPCCGPPAGTCPPPTCPGRVPPGENGRRPGVGCGADIASRMRLSR
jgi:lantibiotic biosynthesis protein